jgi:hypothetical protein
VRRDGSELPIEKQRVFGDLISYRKDRKGRAVIADNVSKP